MNDPKDNVITFLTFQQMALAAEVGVLREILFSSLETQKSPTQLTAIEFHKTVAGRLNNQLAALADTSHDGIQGLEALFEIWKKPEEFSFFGLFHI